MVQATSLNYVKNTLTLNLTSSTRKFEITERVKFTSLTSEFNNIYEIQSGKVKINNKKRVGFVFQLLICEAKRGCLVGRNDKTGYLIHLNLLYS